MITDFTLLRYLVINLRLFLLEGGNVDNTSMLIRVQVNSM